MRNVLMGDTSWAITTRANATAQRRATLRLGMEARAAYNDYVDQIVEPARELGFPAWYIKHLESFRS